MRRFQLLVDVRVPECLGELQEQSVDIFRVLGRCFEEGHSVFVCKLFPHCHVDLSVRSIALVSDEYPMNAVPSIALHLCQPLGKVSECEGRPNIVDEDDGVCTAVVALSDGPKPLLTCSVPDLELREGERERGGEVSLGEVLPKGNNLHVQQQVLIHTKHSHKHVLQEDMKCGPECENRMVSYAHTAGDKSVYTLQRV